MAKEAPVVNTVTMNDGRKVDFPGKRELLKSTTISADGAVTVQMDFANGETRSFTVPQALMLKFAGHGAEQKLGDELAGLKGEGGKPADLDDKVLAIDELIERLNAGDWSAAREANGLSGTSVLIRALVELAAGVKSVEEVKAFLKPKTHAEKLAMRNSPRIKPIVDRLEAEKAKPANAEQVEAGLADFIGA